MPTNGQAVKIAHYTRAKFNSLSTKDNGTIYYVEESDGKIKQYIGNTHVVSDIPSWIGSSKPTYTASEVKARPDTWMPTAAQVGAEPAFTKKTAFNKDFGTTSGTVVQGNDSRMTNARPASDVSAWAKAANKPTYNLGEISETTTYKRFTQTDKTRLDVLHSLLEEDTSNNVVDSINEVLEIFNNYPEGADLVTALAGKVDKVSGKGLSTNDYTTTEKNKLAGIEAGAQKNVGVEFTQAEKTKLSGIATGANVNTVTSVNRKTGAVSLSAADVGARPDNWNPQLKTVNGTPLLGTGDIVIPKGDTGERGPRGEVGQTGADGKDGLGLTPTGLTITGAYPTVIFLTFTNVEGLWCSAILSNFQEGYNHFAIPYTAPTGDFAPMEIGVRVSQLSATYTVTLPAYCKLQSMWYN